VRILQVVHAFFPENTGGTETQTLLLSKALQSRGHEVAVLYRILAPRLAEYTVVETTFEGFPTYKIVNNFTARPATLFSYYDVNVERRFLEVVKKFMPDIVHFQHLGGGLSTSILPAAHRRGLPTVLTLHDFWHMCFRSHLLSTDGQLCSGPDGGLRCIDCYIAQRQTEFALSSVRARVKQLGLWKAIRQLPRFAAFWTMKRLFPIAQTITADLSALGIRDHYMRQLVTSADALLAPSRFLRDFFVQWGVPADQITYFPNGIAPGLRPKPITDSAAHRFGYIGGFHPYKGLKVLIGAFNQLTDVDVTLQIWGAASTPATREYAAQLQSMCRNARVQFAGEFPHSRLDEVLAGLDMLILPSIIYENSPMSILEAFAAGVPVIASNVGGMAELVQHDVNGLLFEMGNQDDLAEKIRFAATHPERIRMYRHNITPPPTSEQIGKSIEALYTDLIKSHQSRRIDRD